MNIERFNSCDELSWKAKDYVVQEIEKNKNLLLCVATGASPTRTYQLLAHKFQEQPQLFDQLRIIKLDEWGGIPMDQTGTCESYIQTYIIQPLQIPESRYIGFNSNPEDGSKECKTIQEKLRKEGPINLCILGLGMNGHLALNEPADFLQAHCHVSKLSPSSLQHPMTNEMQDKPSYGLTLGMADILQSQKVLILISGQQKQAIVKQFLSQKITSSIPASFLWLHPDVTCLIAKEAINLPD